MTTGVFMIKISSLEGNRQWLDGGSMFGNAPRAVWEKWTEVDKLGRIPLACRCLLVEIDDLKILCETGIGAFFEPKLAQRFGVQSPEIHLLVESLKKLDLSPSDIDYVILSHLHFDHAGGLLPTFKEMQDGRNELIFDQAKFIVGKEAWQRANNPHFRDKASFVPNINKLLKESNRLIIIEDNKTPKELTPYIEFIESSGHTPGQMHTLIKSAENKIFFAGDLIPGQAWVHLPITMGYDRYPEKLIEEKQQLYDRFTDESLTLFFTHDAQFSTGKLYKNEKGKFQVTDLVESFSRLEF